MCIISYILFYSYFSLNYCSDIKCTLITYIFLFLGILNKIQNQFHIGDGKGGLLQTAFVISYMVCAPIFGYLGDRYNRKLIMAFGVFLWSLTTFVGSYMNVSFIINFNYI